MLFDSNFDSGVITAYGPIGWPEITAEDFIGALGKMGGRDITIRLQSPGGEVVTGYSIYNQLKFYPGKVRIEVDSLAASIASIIMMAGDEVLVTPGTRVMVHRAYTIEIGNARDFYNAAERLEAYDRDLAAVYAGRANGNADYWFKLMDQETFFNADEAVEAALADGILEPDPANRPEPEPVENRHKVAAPVLAMQDEIAGLRHRLLTAQLKSPRFTGGGK